MVEGPVMIGGSGSSGTTLVSHLLGSHPSIFCGDELHLLNKKTLYERPFRYSREAFRAFLRQGIPTKVVLDFESFFASTCATPARENGLMYAIGKYGLDVEEVCDLAATCETFREFVDGFFEKVIERSGKARWAEKTPTNCFCIGEFLSLYASGKYVHVVRDGRDAVASLMKKGFSLLFSFDAWVALTTAGFPYRSHPRYYELKYENLVVHPEETLGSLLWFLEVDACSELVLGQAREQPIVGYVAPTWGFRPNGEISESSVGKWKHFDYARKDYLERFFRYRVLSDEVSKLWGLPNPCNANRILELLGHDSNDAWNTRPRYDMALLKLYLEEKHCDLFHDRRGMFHFSLS